MLSSLGIPAPARPAQRIAPTGAGSFLTIQQVSPPALGGGDLTALLHFAAFPTGACLPCRRPTVGLSDSDFAISHFDRGSFTDKTIAAMHRGVLQAKTNGPFRAEMERIRQLGRDQGAIGWKDYMGEVVWFDHYYRNIYPLDYVRDPHQVELVMNPIQTYKKRLGDCDCLSSLWAASLGAIGSPHMFTTYRADPRRPSEDSHVASKTHVPNVGWVNNDLTIKGAVPGFEPMGFPSKNWPEPQWS
jgi:hypothetical protein